MWLNIVEIHTPEVTVVMTIKYVIELKVTVRTDTD